MMKEIVEERDDLLKANQILQALIGNRDKEVDRLRKQVEMAMSALRHITDISTSVGGPGN